MTEVGAHQLLDSLVEITAEKDQERFRTSLAGTVRELLPVDDVAFVQPARDLEGQMAFHELRQGPSTLWPTARDPIALKPGQVLEMMRSGQHLEMDARGVALLLPVIHRDALIEIVVVRAPAIPPDALYLLKGFTRLYRNFLALIMESERDPLTGLFNRRTLETRLADLARDAARRHAANARNRDERRVQEALAPHYIAMLDIDHFKRINDTLGHLFGDEVLLLVSRLMREVFRDEDLLFRYGGEEFVAVLVAQTREGATAALNRFRERVAAHRFPQLKQVTVSAGLTEMRARELPAAAIARADQALYCAKEEGRDRVCDYDLLLAAGRLRAESAGHGAELF